MGLQIQNLFDIKMWVFINKKTIHRVLKNQHSNKSWVFLNFS